jgi:hypothetical protein
MATESGATITTQDLYEEIFDQAGIEQEAEETATPEVPESEEAVKEETAEVEPKEEQEQGESPEGEEKKEAEETWFPETLDQLAESLEIDQDALKAIKVKTKVDGVESDVPLGEVIKNYQINKSLTERSENLAHQRKEFEQAIASFVADRDNQVNQWSQWQQLLEQRLREQVGVVDWKQLREDDPAEYAAKRQEFMERISEIESMKAGIEQQRQVQQQQQMQLFQEAVSHNLRRLPELIPEYSNADLMKNEVKEIKEYLLNSGFTEGDLNTMYDARQVAVARKAWLYDKMKKTVEPKKLLLKDKPKFVKPTARTSNEAVTSKAEVDRYKRALKSQHTDDWVEAIMDRL